MMRYSQQPVNMEAQAGPAAAYRVMVRLTDLPAGAVPGDYAVWAARTPEALSPSILQAMASGSLDLSTLGPVRQMAPWYGLRAVEGLTVSPDGPVIGLEGSLHDPATDMQPNTPMSPSWDTAYDASRDRSDGPWLVAVTCNVGGVVTIATGGLGQAAGQEHLAGVWIGSSNHAVEVEIGEWLTATLSAIRPVLNWRMAQIAPAGVDLSVKDVVFTDEIKRPDWPVIYVVPQRETEDPSGISAPDRRMSAPAYTIRCVSYGDDPVTKVSGLTQLAGSIKEILNTRAYRQAELPSGYRFDRAFASSLEWGHTQDSWDDAIDLVWSCEVQPIALF